MPNYNIERIRIFLNDGFRTDELNDLVFFSELLKPVAEEIEDAPKSRKIRAILSYAERRDLMNELLRVAKEENPNAYDRYGPYQHIVSSYGTMPVDSNFYIKRDADDECQRYLNAPNGVTLFVRAPRQMGKSSLIHRLLHYHKGVFIDLQRTPRNYLEDEEAFLKAFCLLISAELGIDEAKIDQHWNSIRSNVANCERYLEEYIIPTVGVPFVLAIDEVRRMTRCDFRYNFFGMLRTWHNNRAEASSNFRQMSLLLSGATNPDSLINTPHQSPFNVAHPILLEDFTLIQIRQLNDLYTSPLSHYELDRLVDLVGGHPFLTQLALHYLTIGQVDLQTLLQDAIEERSIFRSHLEQLAYGVQTLRLREILSKACYQNYSNVPQSDYSFLRNLGLVKQLNGKIVPRNGLYKRFFQEYLDIPMKSCPE